MNISSQQSRSIADGPSRYVLYAIRPGLDGEAELRRTRRVMIDGPETPERIQRALEHQGVLAWDDRVRIIPTGDRVRWAVESRDAMAELAYVLCAEDDAGLAGSEMDQRPAETDHDYILRIDRTGEGHSIRLLSRQPWQHHHDILAEGEPSLARAYRLARDIASDLEVRGFQVAIIIRGFAGGVQ